MKAEIVHGDMYYDILQLKKPNFIFNDWFKWNKLYKRISRLAENNNNPEIVARQVQAWHYLCATTALLKEIDEFDTITKRPRQLR